MNAIAAPMSPDNISPPRANGTVARLLPDPYADGDRLFEVIRGKRVEKNTGLVQSIIASRLGLKLSECCRENQLGYGMIQTMFAIPGSGNNRKPDVAFVSYQKWAKDRPTPEVNAWAVVPDLIVEVISPSDKAFDVMEKVHEYFAGGVREGGRSTRTSGRYLSSPHPVRSACSPGRTISPVIRSCRGSTCVLPIYSHSWNREHN